ncbi:large ribosomal subunit protein bL28m isoform X3 [Chrysemys picta bellii]|uniref:large ribosomal subunit protein bL28m isoform X3 n=1 Tax=Chrysemys picta bellii TaxID=8478 RepID=UPI0032B2991B
MVHAVGEQRPYLVAGPSRRYSCWGPPRGAQGATCSNHCLMPLHKYPPRIWEALKLKQGIYARLPAHYLKSLQDNTQPTPVHWKPLGVKYKLNPKTGQRERVQDVPIPVYYPPESQQGLWGGEGWISGFRYAGNDKLSNRLKKTWKPQLFERELYSEILDKKLTITVTMRTLDLIDAAYGLDFYILKEFVIPEEEAEWVGLSLEEAVEKQRLLEKKDPTPLFKVYVEELVQQLTEQSLSEAAEVKKS